MNISEQSLIYQFQLKAFVASSGTKEYPALWISTNLCPYMRRFLRLFIATCLAFSMLTAAASCMLFVPIKFLLSIPWGDTMLVFFTIGIVLWVILIGNISSIWYIRYGRHNTKYINFQNQAKKVIRTAWRPIGKHIDCNIFVRWYRAVHDRICPELQFYDD